MKLRIVSLLCCGLLLATTLSACKKDEPEAIPDAGAEAPLEVDLPQWGVRYRLMPAWKAQELAPDNSELIADARRVAPEKQPFLVAPRVAANITATPIPLKETVFATVYADIKHAFEKPGLEPGRASRSTRNINGEEAAEFRFQYRVLGKAPQEIVHRVLVAMRPEQNGQHYYLSLTATYLKAQAGLIGPEVDRIFESTQLYLPTPPTPDQEGEK